MNKNRLRAAIARQSHIRRSRDVGWMLFAAAASAALYSWIVAVMNLLESPTGWLAVMIYAVLGLITTYAAWRLFTASVALNRRLEAAMNLSSLSDAERDPTLSIWSELFPRDRDRTRGD